MAKRNSVDTKEKLAERLKNLSVEMFCAAAQMRLSGGFGNTDLGELLVKHGNELDGAANVVMNWANVLASEATK